MTEKIAPERFASLRPGTLIGAGVKRTEDRRLVTGRGRFVDNVHLPGMLHAAVLRSPVPHARIRSIDVSEALALPGVECVLTSADLDAMGINDLMVSWVLPNQKSVSYPLLARDKVRYVGEEVAVVAASSRYVAEDALDLVEVEYEELPSVLDRFAALEADAPLLYEEWGDNIIASIAIKNGDYEQVAREADVIVQERFRCSRSVPAPIETRGAVAHVDSVTGTLTLRTANQAPHRARKDVARILNWPESKMRVISEDVGGAFSGKSYCDEEVLAAVLAIRTGRPVKWIEDRREYFFSSFHCRDQVHDIEVAARRDGTILGIRDRLVTDGGAQAPNVGIGPTRLAALMLPGPYRVPVYDAEAIQTATNKVPTAGVRGFGQPEAVLVMERMLDRLAAALGLDPAEIRFRNLLRPEELPHITASGVELDSGDYPEALRKALALADYDGWRVRQRELREQGRYIGIGMALHTELTGAGPSKAFAELGFKIGGYESVVVRMDNQGQVTVSTAMTATGQGHQTTLAQVCASELGIALRDVVVSQGDTATTPYAPMGSIGDRSAAVGGVAVILASHRLRGKLLQMAGHMLEANAEDLDIDDGAIFVRGTPDKMVTVAEAAEQILLGHDIPEGMTPSLEELETYDPPSLTYSNAANVAILEIDTATGTVTVHKNAVVHDCGTVINPMVVEGQVLGGVGHGLGMAVLEELVYDENGQLLTTSFMDYLLPSAMDMPWVDVGHLESPAPSVLGGMKGVGESGTIAVPGAIANAVEDALASLGARVTEQPLSLARVWSYIHEND